MRALWTCMAAAVACLFAASEGNTVEGFQLLNLDGNRVKWGAPTLGTGARVSYAFVSSPRDFPHTTNCGEMTSLDSLLERSGIRRSEMRREVSAAFRLWERAANIEFVESDDPETAQILVGAQRQPRWFAFANVAYHRTARAAIGTIERSLICLNPTKAWKIGFSKDRGVFDLRYTIAHEIGHAIGLDHAGPAGQLMSFKYLETFRELQPGDIAGAVVLYGPQSRGITPLVASPKPLRTAGQKLFPDPLSR